MFPTSTVVKSLTDLGYTQDLIRTHWDSRDGIQTGSAVPLPVTAFWDRPFDRFRSALAVAELNGLPTIQRANEIVLQTVSHVLLCDDQVAELWLLDRDEIRRRETVPTADLPHLFRRYDEQLSRASVAKQKLRLRQYALYESDPDGQSFGTWAVRPTIEHANAVLTSLVKAVSGLGLDPAQVDDHVRWLFRVLTLRVGKDRDWDVASDLSRESVTDFLERAYFYPSPWNSNSVSSRMQISIAEHVLETLQPMNFASIDPLLIIKAFNVPALTRLRRNNNLFPTPRPYAWDMMSSIPLHPEMAVLDPTVGTGTFLVAAGHALWTLWASSDSALSRLREALYGADSSPFSCDFANIALDLAFGWHEEGWKISQALATDTVLDLPSFQECAIVGNPPWNGSGRSENEAGKILSSYVDAISERSSGWIATIVPRTVWTNRSAHGRSLRERAATNFQMEAVWELPWESISGGRAQAIASVMSRGHHPSATVWKRLDDEGVVHRIGYNTEHGRSDSPILESPDARYLLQKTSDRRKLGNWYNIRVGMQPLPGTPTVLESFHDGQLPYIESKREWQTRHTRPHAHLHLEDVGDDVWVHQYFAYPATRYRSELRSLPQLCIPQNIYEGLSQLSVSVYDSPILFSNRFLICTQRQKTSMDFTKGVARVLTSTIGRLWLHLFATSGRHLAKTSLETFPLPPHDCVERIGTSSELAVHEIEDTDCKYEVVSSGMSVKMEYTICHGYGLNDKEATVVLALGYMLGFNEPPPRGILEQFAPDVRILTRATTELETLDPDEDADEGVKLYLQALEEWDKERYLVLKGTYYELAIDKIAVLK